MLRYVRQIFEKTRTRLLTTYSVEESRNLTLLLLEDILNMAKIEILSDRKIELSPKHQKKLDDGLLRLLNHEPIQHILGKTHFFGKEYFVNKDVLIPRQETEELVDLIIKTINSQQFNILDIGTGSGIIPIALKLELPQCIITGWDVSEEALEVARLNATKLEVHIDFQQVDILSPAIESGLFDVIISNPPYITESEKLLMESNVLYFDPHISLFVPDDDPLLFYKAIATYSLTHLNKQGNLFFEINEKYGDQVSNMLDSLGYSNVKVIKDLNNKDRMVSAIL